MYTYYAVLETNWRDDMIMDHMKEISIALQSVLSLNHYGCLLVPITYCLLLKIYLSMYSNSIKILLYFSIKTKAKNEKHKLSWMKFHKVIIWFFLCDNNK